MSISQRLFADKTRMDSSYMRHDEDWFTFLDRVDDVSCARVRELLNDWFSELHMRKAKTLRAELSSRIPAKVEGAFWELYLHAALARTPFDLSVDVPTGINGVNVDFVATPRGQDEARFSLDAVAVGDPPAIRARARRLKAAWDALNDATPTDFFVWVVEVEQEGVRTPSGTKLRETILAWLDTLDRGTVLRNLEVSPGRSSLPERSFAIDDWRFLVRAMPLSDDAATRADPQRRLVGAEPIETAWGGASKTIRSGLRRKRASKYDSLGLPYAVGLLDLHRVSSGDEDLDGQLFGEEAIQLTFREDEVVSTTPIRRRNGFWTPSTNTRMSAVLYARHLSPWTITRVTPQLWINPWAARPLTVNVPWAGRVSVNDEGKLERMLPETAPAELFGLPDGWPGKLFERRPATPE